jgi:geranylgeranyl reductase family protein
VITADVAVIGAGPAGAATALRLAQLGAGEVVLLDRADFPRDKTCGSGLSPRGLATLRALRVWDDLQATAYPISGLRLVTRGGRETHLSGGTAAAAAICPRRTLDHALLDRARALGVRFLPRFLASELRQEGERVVGVAARDGREVRARFTVVADGGLSAFAVDRRPRRRLQTIMGWWEGVPFRPHHVEMVFDRAVTPGYGWLFPESATRVNIGICYEDPGLARNARTVFDGFLDRQYGLRLRDAQAVGRLRGHPITYAFSVGRLWSPGRVVVGEAGRLVHPGTAEGISQALRSGLFAAEALASVLCGHAAEGSALDAYERRCRRAFDLSFRSAALWRVAIGSSLTDWVVAAMERPALRTALAKVMAAM